MTGVWRVPIVVTRGYWPWHRTQKQATIDRAICDAFVMCRMAEACMKGEAKANRFSRVQWRQKYELFI